MRAAQPSAEAHSKDALSSGRIRANVKKSETLH